MTDRQRQRVHLAEVALRTAAFAFAQWVQSTNDPDGARVNRKLLQCARRYATVVKARKR
jgi:hypothetical protein